MCGEILNRIQLDRPILYGLDPDKRYKTIKKLFDIGFQHITSPASLSMYVLLEDFVGSQHSNIRDYVRPFKTNVDYKDIRYQCIAIFIAGYFLSMHGN